MSGHNLVSYVLAARFFRNALEEEPGEAERDTSVSYYPKGHTGCDQRVGTSAHEKGVKNRGNDVSRYTIWYERPCGEEIYDLARHVKPDMMCWLAEQPCKNVLGA
jgi:hypothetical protein